MPLGPHSLLKNGEVINYQPPFTSFAHFLQTQAKTYANKPALIFEDFDTHTTTTISYADLDRSTLSLASVLTQKYHLQPGDRFSFAFENTPEVILLNFAAWRAGLVTVPLDTKRDTLDHKLYKLKFTDSKLLFTRSDPQTHSENTQLKKRLPSLQIIEVKDFQEFKQKFTSHKSKLKLDARRYSLEADCLILFTSGTTALPKGVRLTITSLFANAESIAHWMRFTAKDRFFLIIPLHHINSTTFANTTLLTGGTIILTPRYSKSNFWPLASKHTCTVSSIVPTIAYDLLSETAAFKQHPQHFTRIQVGSAPVQPTVVEKFMTKYSIPLIQGYGQTETSLRSTGVPMDLTPTQYAHIRHLNSLGTELKYTNATILSSTGKELPENKVGDICVRGPIIMPGYLNNPEANEEAFKFNWFHSGDTGYWRKLYGRQFFFMVGRTKEIIKKGGVLISPVAIENSLLKYYPQLDQVYAVGFPDARLGQEVGIIVITKHPQVVTQVLDLAKTCRLTGLSPYESPQAAIVVSESDLPKTSTGKVQRIKLKDIFGPQLLEQYRTIYPSNPPAGRRSGAASTKSHTFRFIGPEETRILKSALKINNLRWGKNLTSTLKELTSRAENGLLIGAFDTKNQLLGTVSAIHLSRSNLTQPWAKTWNGITATGTLATHNHKGDSLLCVAISTQPQPKSEHAKRQALSAKRKLTPKLLQQYLESNLDPIISFHRTPKAGFKTGAKIVKILKNSRPQDKDSLGYNALMQYPNPPAGGPSINPQATIGTQLIESCLLYAYQKNLKHVLVYTRPATLSQYFVK